MEADYVMLKANLHVLMTNESTRPQLVNIKKYIFQEIVLNLLPPYWKQGIDARVMEQHLEFNISPVYNESYKECTQTTSTDFEIHL